MGEKQEGFPFIVRESESQKNAIVIDKNQDNPVDFDSLSWVLRARSKDKERLNLRGLYSDGMGKFIATDGHRMHIAEIPGMTEKIPKGIWLHVHETKTQISILEAPAGIAPFPAYDAVADVSEKHVPRGMIVHNDDSSTVWKYWDLVGIRCNINYLLDILNDPDEFEIIAADPHPGVISGPEILPVIFCATAPEGNTKKAILMPFK